MKWRWGGLVTTGEGEGGRDGAGGYWSRLLEQDGWRYRKGETLCKYVGTKMDLQGLYEGGVYVNLHMSGCIYKYKLLWLVSRGIDPPISRGFTGSLVPITLTDLISLNCSKHLARILCPPPHPRSITCSGSEADYSQSTSLLTRGSCSVGQSVSSSYTPPGANIQLDFCLTRFESSSNQMCYRITYPDFPDTVWVTMSDMCNVAL